MALKDSLRLESIYFNNLKSMMKMLKSWADGTTDEKTKDIIENCIQADAAILLLYRNLGEAWNELMANIQKEMHDLQDLKETVDAYHDELNEKIDEVNNYLMVLIRELQERVTILEQRVDALETQINLILDLVEDEPAETKGKKNTKAANDPTYHLEYHGETVTYSDIEDMIEAGLDRVIWVRGLLTLLHIVPSSENTITFTRTFYDEANETVIKEKVTIDSTDAVVYLVSSYDIGALEDRVDTVEDDIEAFGGLPSNENANVGNVLTVGEDHVNEWKPASGGDAFLIEARFNETEQIYELYHNDVLLSVTDLKNAADNKYMVVYIVEYDEYEEADKPIYFLIEDVKKYDLENNYFIYELYFIRRFMPNMYVDLGINTNYFLVYFGNYND